MTNDEEILIGATNIGKVLGGVTPETIRKYLRDNPTMPIRKIGGQLTAHRGELRRWWQFFCTDSLCDYKPPSIHELRADVYGNKYDMQSVVELLEKISCQEKNRAEKQ